MFVGGGFGVGLTVAELVLSAGVPGEVPGRDRPARSSEVLPVSSRTPEEKALELGRVARLEAVIAAVRRELTARDAASAEVRRRDAEAAADVTVRPVGEGMSELVARLPHPLAVACRDTLTGHARAAEVAGDARRLKTHARGWRHAMTADGVLTVTTPSGVPRPTRPPGLHLQRQCTSRAPALPITGARVLTAPPQPSPPPDPADDHPPL